MWSLSFLVSFLLTLNTFSWCFYCGLWTSKYRLNNIKQAVTISRLVNSILSILEVATWKYKYFSFHFLFFSFFFAIIFIIYNTSCCFLNYLRCVQTKQNIKFRTMILICSFFQFWLDIRARKKKLNFFWERSCTQSSLKLKHCAEFIRFHFFSGIKMIPLSATWTQYCLASTK